MAVKNWSVAVGFFCHLCKPAKDYISTQSSPAIIALAVHSSKSNFIFRFPPRPNHRSSSAILATLGSSGRSLFESP